MSKDSRELRRKKRKMMVERWSPLLDAGDKAVKGRTLRENTAQVLENQMKYFKENTTTTTPGFDTYLKITVPLIRRIFPELIANDLVGVQPMSGPVGLAFAMRFRFANSIGDVAAGDEAGYNLVDPRYSGTQNAINAYGTSANGWLDDYNGGKALETSASELVGEDWTNYPSTTGYEIPEIDISVESETIRAFTRKLKASWTLEIQQDLASVHDIDIDSEMVGMLSYQIQAEIDREVVGRMINVALVSGNVSTWAPATADGRWQAEKFVTLYYRILIECNSIAITTRRGAGNFLIASPTVVAALQTLDIFQFYPIENTINSAETGLAKVGTLDSRITVYRDTFSTANYILVGYKGTEQYDSGIIYCPYIPLLISRVQGEDDFMPRIGLMTRYGITQNLFGAENYYRLIKVDFANSGGVDYATVVSPYSYDANNNIKPVPDFPDYT
jgi:hypothetical protein